MDVWHFTEMPYPHLPPLDTLSTMRVTLRFLDPIDPHEAGDRKALAARSQAEVAQALGAFAGGGDPLYPPQ